MPRKNNYVPSIIQTGAAKCYLCGKQYGLEIHHAIPGRGNRAICTELGLVTWLCEKCHRDLHDKGIGYKKIQADAQKAFIADRKKKGLPESVAREEWYSRFMKFYEDEE